MAAHILAIFMLHKSIQKKLRSILIRFWWGAREGRRPIYWKKSNLLEDHKSLGGLGIQNIESLNHALLFKQAWRIQSQPNLLVSKIFNAKYQGRWFKKSMEEGSPVRSSSWGARSIMRSVCSLKAGTRRVVGNGESISITEDVWVGDSKINFKQPQQPDGSPNLTIVAELLNVEGNAWQASSVWSLFHNQTARAILAKHIPLEKCGHGREWGPSANGNYNIKSGYWLHKRGDSPLLEESIFWKKWWKVKLWPKWKIFIWKIVHNAIPTRINLAKRKIDVPKA